MQVEFWAKTTSDDQPGISVFKHMVNVGCVAHCLAEVAPDLLQRFQLRVAVVGALAALHDLGKISPGFQQKCAAWLEANGLTEIAQRWTWDTTMEPDHGKVSHAAVQNFLVSIGTNRRAAKFLSAILGGHHGKLNPPNDRGFQPSKQISEQHSGIDWDKQRNEAAQAICDLFDADLAAVSAEGDSPELWWPAGLTSVADWIGSGESFFSPDRGFGSSNPAKVVIRNEVHSYDIYTETLDDKLICAMGGLGCTVIVLSATLTGKRQNQMVGVGDKNEDKADLSCPPIRGGRSGEDFQSL